MYLTMLFAIIVLGLTSDHLLGISPIKKYSFLLLGNFLLALLATMKFYYNDSQQNKYLKQRVHSYWSDVLSQFLVILIINIFSGVLIFIFSLILNRNIELDTVGILTLISVGLLGSSIAALFKTQWYRHSSLGQIGILVLVYLAFSGSVISLLEYIDWLLPPLSKLMVALQTNPSIPNLLPITGQTYLYSMIIFVISSFIYKPKK